MAKILIVDDSAFARNSLKMIVESGGHEVVGRAENGDQALDLFARLHPELVLLDYLMAGKSGEDVLEEIIRQNADAKVIMVSGSGDHDLEDRTLRAGARYFVEKPYSKGQLLGVIDQVMSA